MLSIKRVNVGQAEAKRDALAIGQPVQPAIGRVEQRAVDMFPVDHRLDSIRDADALRVIGVTRALQRLVRDKVNHLFHRLFCRNGETGEGFGCDNCAGPMAICDADSV
jgi:hypothetical protein